MRSLRFGTRFLKRTIAETNDTGAEFVVLHSQYVALREYEGRSISIDSLVHPVQGFVVDVF